MRSQAPDRNRAITLGVVLVLVAGFAVMVSTRESPPAVSKSQLESDAKLRQVQAETSELLERVDRDQKTKLGMTTDEARAALGKPESVKRDVGTVLAERWIYPDRELYFVNGTLRRWSDR